MTSLHEFVVAVLQLLLFSFGYYYNFAPSKLYCVYFAACGHHHSCINLFAITATITKTAVTPAQQAAGHFVASYGYVARW